MLIVSTMLMAGGVVHARGQYIMVDGDQRILVNGDQRIVVNDGGKRVISNGRGQRIKVDGGRVSIGCSKPCQRTRKIGNNNITVKNHGQGSVRIKGKMDNSVIDVRNNGMGGVYIGNNDESKHIKIKAGGSSIDIDNGSVNIGW